MKYYLHFTPVLMISACNAASEPPASDKAMLALARALVDACPATDLADSAAREQCADALTKIDVLRDQVTDTILWGGQPAGLPLEEVMDEASLTEFNPFVWKKMYLSTFIFERVPERVEVAGKYRVLRMPVRFRSLMEAGEYPYPFWHSEGKWLSYERSTDVLLFFVEGVLVGGARSENQDATRPHVDRVWDGQWTWEDGSEPRVSLFRYLFSSSNPHVERLDAAYRSFAEGIRTQNCTSCHDPKNDARMKHLELLNYPNQALSGRHDVVRVVEENIMPPGAGVSDQIVRLDLVRLATAFAAAGDEALAFEGER